MLWGTSALGLAPQARDPKGRPWPETARGGLLGISGKIEAGFLSLKLGEATAAPAP